MKKFLWIAMLMIAGTGTAMAQKQSVVGKWSLSSLTTDQIVIDLENPASAKKVLAEQITKEAGAAPDSATVEMAYTAMTGVLKNMTFEFTQDGKAIFNVLDQTGAPKQETAKYTVDYATNTMITTETKDGKEKKETVSIKFEGNNFLVMKKEGKTEIIKIKRIP